MTRKRRGGENLELLKSQTEYPEAWAAKNKQADRVKRERAKKGKK